jgi:iron complex transport system substrate-binding protein
MRFRWAAAAALWLASSLACAAAPRIVSLAPSLTELSFTAGAGADVIATVDYSDYPPAARSIPRIGDAFRVDLERLLGLKPDIVLAWETGTPVTTIERVRELGLKVRVVRVQTLAEIAQAIRDIGAIAGTQSVAEKAAHEFESHLGRLRARYAGSTPVRAFVEVNAQPLYTVNGNHAITEVLGLCGGVNVFADLNDIAPVVGVEAVGQRHPEVILGASDDDTQPMKRWSQWPFVDAVRTHDVHVVHSDLLTRPSARLADGADEVCGILERVREKRARELSNSP